MIYTHINPTCLQFSFTFPFQSILAPKSFRFPQCVHSNSCQDPLSACTSQKILAIYFSYMFDNENIALIASVDKTSSFGKMPTSNISWIFQLDWQTALYLPVW